MEPINLKSNAWAIVYSNKNYDDANNLLDLLKKASKTLGV